jgi:hypothetical protein
VGVHGQVRCFLTPRTIVDLAFSRESAIS